MPATDAQAEAVTALAKTSGKVVDAVAGVGAFLKETVGDVPKDLIGLAGGDWVHEQRRRNVARMQAKTERILCDIDPARISEPSASVVLPLLSAAADESREELQDLWAALLANAMVDGGKRVRRDYFEAVRQMEPVDSVVLDIVAHRPNPHTADAATFQNELRFIEEERQRRSLSPDDMEIAMDKLIKLGCVYLGG